MQTTETKFTKQQASIIVNERPDEPNFINIESLMTGHSVRYRIKDLSKNECGNYKIVTRCANNMAEREITPVFYEYINRNPSPAEIILDSGTADPCLTCYRPTFPNLTIFCGCEAKQQDGIELIRIEDLVTGETLFEAEL